MRLSGQHKSASPQCPTDPDQIVSGKARIFDFFTHSCLPLTYFGPYSVFWESMSSFYLFEYSFVCFRVFESLSVRTICNQPQKQSLKIAKASIAPTTQPIIRDLFNRDAFSQVARLIDVRAPRHGHVIRQ